MTGINNSGCEYSAVRTPMAVRVTDGNTTMVAGTTVMSQIRFIGTQEKP